MICQRYSLKTRKKEEKGEKLPARFRERWCPWPRGQTGARTQQISARWRSKDRRSRWAGTGQPRSGPWPWIGSAILARGRSRSVPGRCKDPACCAPNAVSPAFDAPPGSRRSPSHRYSVTSPNESRQHPVETRPLLVSKLASQVAPEVL